jgi:hypothetical protein
MNGIWRQSLGLVLETCAPLDVDLFTAATKVTIGNGKKALFWEASWINGMRPKDIAPLIFDLLKHKKCTVAKALEVNFWVSQINNQDGLSLEHIVQFAKLLEALDGVHLQNKVTDTIIWNLTKYGCNFSKTAYSMQFFGHSKPPCLFSFGSLEHLRNEKPLLG